MEFSEDLLITLCVPYLKSDMGLLVLLLLSHCFTKLEAKDD